MPFAPHRRGRFFLARERRRGDEACVFRHSDAMTAPPITHDAIRRRYSLHIDGHEAYLTYETPRPGHRHITHTIVPDALGGRGLGKQLVSAIMADVLAAAETVSSTCWYASALIEKTPDWAERTS
jgi:uncharacterized protein